MLIRFFLSYTKSQKWTSENPLSSRFKFTTRLHLISAISWRFCGTTELRCALSKSGRLYEETPKYPLDPTNLILVAQFEDGLRLNLILGGPQMWTREMNEEIGERRRRSRFLVENIIVYQQVKLFESPLSELRTCFTPSHSKHNHPSHQFEPPSRLPNPPVEPSE